MARRSGVVPNFWHNSSVVVGKGDMSDCLTGPPFWLPLCGGSTPLWVKSGIAMTLSARGLDNMVGGSLSAHVQRTIYLSMSDFCFMPARLTGDDGLISGGVEEKSFFGSSGLRAARPNLDADVFSCRHLSGAGRTNTVQGSELNKATKTTTKSIKTERKCVMQLLYILDFRCLQKSKKP
jgi:hypothetical protein